MFSLFKRKKPEGPDVELNEEIAYEPVKICMGFTENGFAQVFFETQEQAETVAKQFGQYIESAPKCYAINLQFQNYEGANKNHYFFRLHKTGYNILKPKFPGAFTKNFGELQTLAKEGSVDVVRFTKPSVSV